MAFAKHSRFLQRLSLVDLIRVWQFFIEFWPDRPIQNPRVPWENLQTLTLTAHPHFLTGNKQEISKLLVAAGRAAACMPKLDFMKLWTHDPNTLTVFTHSYNPDQPQISWLVETYNNQPAIGVGRSGPEYTPLSIDEFGCDAFKCWAELPKVQNAAKALKLVRVWTRMPAGDLERSFFMSKEYEYDVSKVSLFSSVRSR